MTGQLLNAGRHALIISPAMAPAEGNACVLPGSLVAQPKMIAPKVNRSRSDFLVVGHSRGRTYFRPAVGVPAADGLGPIRTEGVFDGRYR